MQSHRSPRQPVSRSRAKPYARRPPPARSGSIMATIKNIVTAPLSWFATAEEFEDTPGKRRRARDGDAPAAKKQRLASPETTTNGYLDPPRSAFQSPTKLDSKPTALAFSPSVSINIPANTHRHTYSPIPYSQHDLPRTMSMDPPAPQPLARDATMIPLPHSREHSMASRDHSMGPVPFRMRTTLSPHPSGQDFGPKPQRRNRDPSEPPPLTALMSNPIFVKPPPDAIQRSRSAQPTVTLGSLTQNNRPVRRRDIAGSARSQDFTQTRSPLRHSSGLLFGNQTQDPSFRPVNASEIALSELAVYRTPLLPTRLRGSTAIPDMFKPKKIHQLVPMHRGKDEMPRLGTVDKKKQNKDQGGKPYSGQGGMKKLLARRKLEAEAEKKRDKSEAMTDDNEEKKPESSKVPEAAAVIPEPVVQQHRVSGRETSSLRVGRTRVSRQHVERPESARPNKNKFSAVYEEEDSTDHMDQGGDADVEEPVRLAPIFEAPKGFSFAQEAAPTPAPAMSDAKEPPIAALPFSLTTVKPTQQPAKAPLSTPAPPTPAKSAFSFPITAPATPAAPTPAFSLIPPTPETASKTSDATPSIPNFFANSARLSKSPSASPLPPSTNLFGAPASAPAEKSASNGFLSPAAPSPSFTAHVQPAAQTSLFGGLPSNLAETKPPTSLFGGNESKSFGSALAAAPASAAGGSMFSFVAPKAEPAVAPVNNEPSKPTQGPLFGTGSNSLFGGFGSGATTSETTKAATLFGQPSNEPPTSLFGGPSNESKEAAKPAPFTFSSTSTPVSTTEAKEAPKPAPFSFGSSSTPVPANDIKEAPKPAPFTFGSPAPASVSPSKFKFDTAPATPPAEKQLSPLLFGGASTPAPNMFSFGAAPAADTSKSFFGNNIPRPVTPPKADNEERMEESPVRSIETSERPPMSDFFASRSLNFSQSGGSAPGAFSFGASPSASSTIFGAKPEEKAESKPGFAFGSTSSSGFGSGFGQQKQPEPSSQPPFSQTPSFSFGKPESNGQQQQQAASTSPFGFGVQKLPENNAPGSSPFGFGTQKLPETNGQQAAPGSSPFGFGTQKLPETNPAQGAANSSPFGFGVQKLPEINTNNQSFGFSQKAPGSSQGGNAFGFDQKPPGSSQGTGSFSFGAQPSPITATPSFGFGSSQPNGFGQVNSSAPSSPSTFNQPSPFGFGSSVTPTTAPSNGFSFQPSSPATNAGAFSFNQTSAPQVQLQAPASPFSAPTSPQTPGGTLFTMGAAPAAAGGPRQMKKLPTRRGGKR